MSGVDRLESRRKIQRVSRAENDEESNAVLALDCPTAKLARLRH